MQEENKDYAAKLIKILNTEFSDWEAKREGIIDDKGNLLKIPSDEQKSTIYTSEHAVIRSLKRSIESLGKEKAKVYTSRQIDKLCELSNLTRQDFQSDEYLKEAMVVGDGDYNASNIASGDVSGSIVGGGPSELERKKYRKKLSSVIKK